MFSASSLLSGLHLNFVEATIDIGKQGKISTGEAKEMDFLGLWKSVEVYLYIWKYLVE